MSRTQTRFRPALAAPLAFLLLSSALACGDDNGSEPRQATPLDPQLVTAASARVASVADQPIFEAILSLESSFIPVGALRAPAAVPVRALRRSGGGERPLGRASSLSARLSAAAAQLGGFIPAALRGKSLIFDRGTSRWVVDGARTGAPANGVRFVVGPTVGAPAAPLVGHVDVEDRGTTGKSRLVGTVTDQAGVNVMSWDHRIVGNWFEPGYADTLTGEAVKGTDRVVFSETEVIEPPGTGGGTPVSRSTFSWSLAAAGVSSEGGGVERDAATDSVYTVMRIGNRTLRTSNLYVPDTEFGGFQPGDTTRVYLDDVLYALLILPRDESQQLDFDIVRPNGTQLPSDERLTLVQSQVMSFNVATLFFVPFIVSFWVEELAFGDS